MVHVWLYSVQHMTITLKFIQAVIGYTFIITTGLFIEGNLVMTYCNWVKPWAEVSESQKEYLQNKEYLNHCNMCKVSQVTN